MLSTPAWLSAGGHQCFAAMGMVRTKRSRAMRQLGADKTWSREWGINR